MDKGQQKKEKDTAANAHDQAEKDILKDPEFSDGDATDDLDEGELARRDNSDEDALDSLERPRRRGEQDHSGNEKKSSH
jgi:hypothetical protein